MPRSMHLNTEIYPNLKSISELFKMYMESLDSFILASRDNWNSCNQTLGCLRLYGDSRVSRAQPRINAYEILLPHDFREKLDKCVIMLMYYLIRHLLFVVYKTLFNILSINVTSLEQISFQMEYTLQYLPCCKELGFYISKALLNIVDCRYIPAFRLHCYVRIYKFQINYQTPNCFPTASLNKPHHV